MKTGVLTRIAKFNEGRDPERLALKFAALRHDAFTLLRGTCHLFYEDLRASDLPMSPLVWCCGDLHLENFGTYKGDNRLAYFDLNDFDEACLTPALWELVRFLTSVRVGGKTLGMDRRMTTMLMRTFLEGYAGALRGGKARWLERATSDGIIRALLTDLKKRTRTRFLQSRTTLRKGTRQLLIDGQRALSLDKTKIETLRKFLAEFGRSQPNPQFFQLLDAARRVAGVGSLGLERYVLLVEGRGSPDGNFLFDFKVQPGSCVVAAHPLSQPHWASEGERVAVTQREMQAVSWQRRSFLLHELMPINDRLDITKWQRGADGLARSIHNMGEIVAWDQIRSAARRGAALPAELIDFGRDKTWWKSTIECAGHYATRTEQQWREYTSHPVESTRKGARLWLNWRSIWNGGGRFLR